MTKLRDLPPTPPARVRAPARVSESATIEVSALGFEPDEEPTKPTNETALSYMAMVRAFDALTAVEQSTLTELVTLWPMLSTEARQRVTDHARREASR